MVQGRGDLHCKWCFPLAGPVLEINPEMPEKAGKSGVLSEAGCGQDCYQPEKQG